MDAGSRPGTCGHPPTSGQQPGPEHTPAHCSLVAGSTPRPAAVQNCSMKLQTSAGTQLVGCPGSFGDG